MGSNSAVRWGRLAAAVAVGGAMALGAAGSAAAEPVDGVASTTSTKFDYYDTSDKWGKESLKTLTLGPQVVPVYCIQKHVKIGDGRTYTEASWGEATVPNLDKVQWILAHSTPNVSDAEVLAKAGVGAPDGANAETVHKLVYAGTQTAIWHFSDGFDLGAKTDDTIEAVYRYLIGNATGQAEPPPSLKIDPASKTGDTDTKVGPFTVVSTGDVTLSASGAKLVKDDGSEISGKVPNGTQFYVTSSTAGRVTVDATSDDAKVQYGRAFVAKDGPNEHQKVILGGVLTTKATAKVEVTFKKVEATPSPTPTPSPSLSPSTAPSVSRSPSAPALPVTGASATGALLLGAVLLGGGGLLLMTLRRRKIKFTA